MRFLLSQKDDMEQIISHYGKQAQKLMVLEEMAELQKEVCKSFRGKRNRDEIIEEMADVYIMLEQLQLMYGINDEVLEGIAQEKIERQMERMRTE